mgnify:CR=1 FL=1
MEDETATVVCDTTKGEIEMLMTRKWSPHGYDKAVELFERGFYDNSHFFRAVPDFLVQFGISYTEDKELKKFGRQTVPDDPQLNPRIPFEPGTISFAGSGPNSRDSQLFIAYRGAESFGRELWETPIGKVVRGMENAVQFYSYGDGPPFGNGPSQQRIHEGRQYIDENFPHLDSFLECEVTRSTDVYESGEEEHGDDDDGVVAGEEGASGDSHHFDALHHHMMAEPSAIGMIGNGDVSFRVLGALAMFFLLAIVFIRHQGRKDSNKAL